MLLGLLSLLLTIGQDRILDICTSKAVGATWHPCNNKQDVRSDKSKDKSSASDDNSRQRLLSVLLFGDFVNIVEFSSHRITIPCSIAR
ncbi:hypothetical protein EV1_034360 [Malus domestica]